MGLGKKFNEAKTLLEAREQGWEIAHQAGMVVFSPPDGLPDEERLSQQECIARAVAEIAVRFGGYCYQGCK